MNQMTGEAQTWRKKVFKVGKSFFADLELNPYISPWDLMGVLIYPSFLMPLPQQFSPLGEVGGKFFWRSFGTF